MVGGWGVRGWPSRNIAITNVVWCVAYKRGVGGGAYIAQWSCNSIPIGLSFAGGGGQHKDDWLLQ